jgi:stage V sporulation protein AB
MILNTILLIIFGLSGGLLVGAGFVALLSVLDIIPRMIQVIGSKKFTFLFQWTVILGPIFFTVMDFFPTSVYFSQMILIVPGFFMGIFVGLLAAALTEVINVIPILTRRMHMYDYIYFFILAIALGKSLGSLFHWLVYVP